MLSSVSEFNFEVKTRTATRFLSLLLSCVALGSDTQGTHKEQNLFFVRHAREWKLESDVRKNRSIKPKFRWKAKKSPGVWQGQHQTLEVQQTLISLTQEIITARQRSCIYAVFQMCNLQIVVCMLSIRLKANKRRLSVLLNRLFYLLYIPDFAIHHLKRALHWIAAT